MPVPAEYVTARTTLLDALDALSDHVNSLVLIGSQAIYVHTGEGTFREPPMTTDADIAIDADLLGTEPEVAATLEAAHFSLGPKRDQQPGHWMSPRGVSIDLMVAQHQSGRPNPGARSVRVGPHSHKMARSSPGLALALLDKAPHVIDSLEASDRRSHEINVAGPTALTVAKALKIRDRMEDAARGQSRRIVDKDALDLVRLLQALSPERIVDALGLISPGSPAETEFSQAVDFLQADLLGNQEIGHLATRAGLGDPTVAPLYRVLANEFVTVCSSQH